jgi:hypothetical protein
LVKIVSAAYTKMVHHYFLWVFQKKFAPNEFRILYGRSVCFVPGCYYLSLPRK